MQRVLRMMRSVSNGGDGSSDGSSDGGSDGGNCDVVLDVTEAAEDEYVRHCAEVPTDQTTYIIYS